MRTQKHCINARHAWHAVRRVSDCSSSGGSYLASVPRAPVDMILGYTRMHSVDTDPRKVNLAVGVYRTDDGKPYILECVKKAAATVLEDSQMDYAPINGLVSFHESARRICFGDELDNAVGHERIATVQTCSGTGALHIAAELLARFGKRPSSRAQDELVVYVPTPTYPNHKGIFTSAHLHIESYPYYNDKTHSVDIDAMLSALRQLPPCSVVVLHACAHNPTGADPTMGQWEAIIDVCEERNLIPLVDMAYQGFCTGDLGADGYLPRALCRRGIDTFFVAQSFAKNMGLYGQRTGALHIFCKDHAEKERVLSQTAVIARASYSNPPIFGARIVDVVARDAELTALWHTELKRMADRMTSIRAQLVKHLALAGSTRDWSHLTETRGMMALTGLSMEQVEKLRNDHHIYMIPSGRVAFSGLTTHNVEYVAKCIHSVTS